MLMAVEKKMEHSERTEFVDVCRHIRPKTKLNSNFPAFLVISITLLSRLSHVWTCVTDEN